MCFSLEASLGFTALGLVTGGILYARGRPAWAWSGIVYAACMELLQAMQYAVMAYDDAASGPTGSASGSRSMCISAPGRGSWANKLLMVLSWAHIALQPYYFNK